MGKQAREREGKEDSQQRLVIGKVPGKLLRVGRVALWLCFPHCSGMEGVALWLCFPHCSGMAGWRYGSAPPPRDDRVALWFCFPHAQGWQGGAIVLPPAPGMTGWHFGSILPPGTAQNRNSLLIGCTLNVTLFCLF